MTNKAHEIYLEPTFFFDFNSQIVQDFVKQHTNEVQTPAEKARNLFNAVRDGWFYSPYNLYEDRAMLKASAIMKREKGHCQDKACILITCFRAINLPSRLHLAKVVNHIAVEELTEKLGTKELTPHASVQVFLNDKWLDVVPAFNRELCDKLGVDCLEFDGQNDALFQQFDKEGNQFMEYIEDYGLFTDYPYDFVRTNLMEHYPDVIKWQ